MPISNGSSRIILIRIIVENLFCYNLMFNKHTEKVGVMLVAKVYIRSRDLVKVRLY